MKRTICAVDEAGSAQEPDAKRCKNEEAEQETVLQVDLQEFECVICADLMVDPVVGRCGHDFCKECLEDWVYRNRHNANCPVCRKSLGSSQDEHGICLRLKDLIERLFPRRSKDRRREVEQEAAERKRRREHDVEQRRLQQQQRHAAYAAAMAGNRSFHRMQYHPASAAAMAAHQPGEPYDPFTGLEERLGRIRDQLGSLATFMDETDPANMAGLGEVDRRAAVRRGWRDAAEAAGRRGPIRTRSAARHAAAAAGAIAGTGSNLASSRRDAIAAAAAAGRAAWPTSSTAAPSTAPNAVQPPATAPRGAARGPHGMEATLQPLLHPPREQSAMAVRAGSRDIAGVQEQGVQPNQAGRQPAAASWGERAMVHGEQRRQVLHFHLDDPVPGLFGHGRLHSTDGTGLYHHPEPAELYDDAAHATRYHNTVRHIRRAREGPAAAARGGASELRATPAAAGAAPAAAVVGESRQGRELAGTAAPPAAMDPQDDWLADLNFDNTVGDVTDPLLQDIAQPALQEAAGLPVAAAETFEGDAVVDPLPARRPSAPAPAAAAAAPEVYDDGGDHDDEEPAHFRRLSSLNAAALGNLRLQSTFPSPPAAGDAAARDGGHSPGAARASMIPVIPLDFTAEYRRANDADVLARAAAAAAAQASARARIDRRVAERRRAAEVEASAAPAAAGHQRRGSAEANLVNSAAAHAARVTAAERRPAADRGYTAIRRSLRQGQALFNLGGVPSGEAQGRAGQVAGMASVNAEVRGGGSEAAERQHAGQMEAAAGDAARAVADTPAVAAAAGAGAVQSRRTFRIKRPARPPAEDSDASSGRPPSAAEGRQGAQQQQRQAVNGAAADSSRRGAFLDMMASAGRSGHPLLTVPAQIGAVRRSRALDVSSEMAETGLGNAAAQAAEPPAQTPSAVRARRDQSQPMRIRLRVPLRSAAAIVNTRAEETAENQPAAAAAALAPARSAELLEEVARATARHVRREVEGLLTGGLARRQMGTSASMAVVDGGYISSGSDDH